MRKLSLLVILLFLGLGGYFGLVGYNRAGESRTGSSSPLVRLPLPSSTSAQPLDESLPAKSDDSITATPQHTISPSPSETPPTVPSATPPPSQPVGQAGNWLLLFNDEFDGHTLETGKWTTCYWWDDNGCTIITNDELEWYQPENVRVQDGLLVLQATEQVVNASNGRTYDYTSGMVSTGRSTDDADAPLPFAFQYGYAEIRALIPAGKGLWPAFWMLPITHESLPEVDIMEILGHAPDILEMHYHYRENDQKLVAGSQWQGPDFSQDWHTFALDWRPDALIWYVDGVERWRFTDASVIPAEPMYLLINLAVGGEWPGSPDAATVFPSLLLVDYVRVWQPISGPR